MEIIMIDSSKYNLTFINIEMKNKGNKEVYVNA
jgi:hypothetical protein